MGVHTHLPAPHRVRTRSASIQEAGLHQNWMRDHDPTTGRYIQADPLGLVDGPSLYGYALQKPGGNIDFTGLASGKKIRYRSCNSKEWGTCMTQCGAKGVESCVVQQTYRATGTRGGIPQWDWVDAKPSCSCNEPFCGRNPLLCVLGICGLLATPWPDDLLIPLLVGAGALVH